MLKTVSAITNSIGAVNYKGLWNASTNTPTLASGVGTKGDYYVVSVAGSTNLDGITNWTVGDWAVFSGTAWQRLEGGQVDLTNGVTGILPSANGGTGNGFTKFSGPSTSEKTFTLPDANATLARTDAAQTFTGDQLFNDQLNVGGANLGTKASVTNTGGWGIGSKVGYGGWWPHYVWSADTGIDNFFVRFDTESAATQRGSITYNRGAGLVAYNTTSDYRAKDILGPVINSGATIDALKVYSGMMKGATQARPMLIAHEAQEVTPYAVTGEKDGVDPDTGVPAFQQMDHSSYVPLLIAEIQSLRARIAAIESK